MERRQRAILITGGGSGIGRAAALLCGARGDRVAILDKNGESAEQTAHDVLAAGAEEVLGLSCDVTDEDRVAQSFTMAVKRFGPLYGVFANAGIDIGGQIHEMPLERWEFIIATNLTGIFLTCKHALRHMIESAIAGSIVCTSSPCGFVALAAGGAGAYSATKGAISSLVRCMAVDYAKYRIRVNAIAPGATETGMTWNNVAASDVERTRAQLNHEIPVGRLATAEEPARAALWLLSEESSYVTGSHLVCDGGILAKACISV